MFTMYPLTIPRSKLHCTRMQMFGITRGAAPSPTEVRYSREFEAGRVAFAGGVPYSTTSVLACVSYPPAC